MMKRSNEKDHGSKIRGSGGVGLNISGYIASALRNHPMTSAALSTLWDLESVQRDLQTAHAKNSEPHLLKTLKQNTFLFCELIERQFSVQPIFHEVTIGSNRCDFAWLNDSSDGPEWVLVEVERPGIQLFTQKGDPSAPLNHAIEQVKSWRQYFNQFPAEKARIFGAVKSFRYVLVAGSTETWNSEHASKWRADRNSEDEIEIRTNGIFSRAIKSYRMNPDAFWSYSANPNTRDPSTLEAYWTGYSYFNDWRKWLH
ncbi:MAG TPA: DUF4263 domain-containing protein [Flavobacteriales bacterium]|nr:DUF4263 domain-containing protein [Flavobacteriales bacterium]